MTDTQIKKTNAEIRSIMDAVRAKYVPSARDKEVDDGIDFLVERLQLKGTPGQTADAMRRPEARGLVILGDSGSGKTTTTVRRLAKRPDLPDYGQPSCKVVSVTAPAPCTLGQLGRATLTAIGYPLSSVARKEHEIWAKTREKLADAQVTILHYDEVQNITDAANVAESVRLRDTLKSCLNNAATPVGLILSGLPSVRDFLEEDYQLVRRMRFIRFERLTSDDAGRLQKTTAMLAETAGLTFLPSNDVSARLIHAARGAMGLSIEMACDAVEDALKCGNDAVTIKNFAAQYSARTGCGPKANIFLANNWPDIDPTRVLTNNPQEYLAPQIIQLKKQRKGQ